MKMTIEIPEDVLAELMQLTGHHTKRDAVEFALREAARRAKWRRVWSEGLGMTPDELLGGVNDTENLRGTLHKPASSAHGVV